MRRPVPLFFAWGEGARLFDVDGTVYIDYILGNGPAILRQAPPRRQILKSVQYSVGRSHRG
jgi:glutamate-1-semialdehyde 2,1-aminomutase